MLIQNAINGYCQACQETLAVCACDVVPEVPPSPVLTPGLARRAFGWIRAAMAPDCAPLLGATVRRGAAKFGSADYRRGLRFQIIIEPPMKNMLHGHL